MVEHGVQAFFFLEDLFLLRNCGGQNDVAQCADCVALVLQAETLICQWLCTLRRGSLRSCDVGRVTRSSFGFLLLLLGRCRNLEEMEARFSIQLLMD